MAIRKILLETDETLRKKSRSVTDFNQRLWDILDDMSDTLTEANGTGLAAPQVGILRRIVIIDVGEGQVEYINPEIIESEGEQKEVEGCLSIPGQWGIVARPQKVRVKAQDRYGKPFTAEGEDLLAIAFCHEIDHLDGILYTDKVIEMVQPEELER